MPRDKEVKNTTENASNRNTSPQRLKSYIDRIERLNCERDDLGADVREVFAEAKSEGFDIPAMRHVIKLRKMDSAKRQELEAMVDAYFGALGDLAGTPLASAAVTREFGAAAQH